MAPAGRTSAVYVPVGGAPWRSRDNHPAPRARRRPAPPPLTLDGHVPRWVVGAADGARLLAILLEYRCAEFRAAAPGGWPRTRPAHRGGHPRPGRGGAEHADSRGGLRRRRGAGSRRPHQQVASMSLLLVAVALPPHRLCAVARCGALAVPTCSVSAWRSPRGVCATPGRWRRREAGGVTPLRRPRSKVAPPRHRGLAHQGAEKRPAPAPPVMTIETADHDEIAATVAPSWLQPRKATRLTAR